jgi:glycosyltransferase involved in cell wall biosynthesis
VIPLLTAYDAVVVPSQWVETGPLVVLESFAAGVPVLASELGGIAEKVRHDVDGLLVPAYQLHAAWSSVIERCVSDPAVLPRLRAGVTPPRSMNDVAREMAQVYAQVVASPHAPEMSTP